MFSRACPPIGPREVKVKQVGSEPPTLSARAALLLSLVCGSRLRCLGWGWSGGAGALSLPPTQCVPVGHKCGLHWQR